MTRNEIISTAIATADKISESGAIFVPQHFAYAQAKKLNPSLPDSMPMTWEFYYSLRLGRV